MALMNAGPDEPETAAQRAAIQHMMRCLDGFARGLGLDGISSAEQRGGQWAQAASGAVARRPASADRS